VKWTDDLLDRKRLLMDPLADQVVAEIVERNGEESAFRVFDLLIRNIEMPIEDLPDEVDTFVSETDRLPAWVDWQQIETSEELFLDHGPKFLLFLYYKSLPLLYTDAKGAEVLVRTGRLSHKEGDHRIFTRRIAETGQFMMDVMARDGLQPGSDGIRSIQKVRLIHAAIRRFLNNRGWDREKGWKTGSTDRCAYWLKGFRKRLYGRWWDIFIISRNDHLIIRIKAGRNGLLKKNRYSCNELNQRTTQNHIRYDYQKSKNCKGNLVSFHFNTTFLIYYSSKSKRQ
jgi:hypothetical protein